MWKELSFFKVPFLFFNPEKYNLLYSSWAVSGASCTRWLEISHTDQITGFLKHAPEANDVHAFSPTLSSQNETRLSGAIPRNAYFAPQCRCSPKLPRGSLKGRRKGENSTLRRQKEPARVCVCTSSTDVLDSSLLRLSSPRGAAAYICAVHPHAAISARQDARGHTARCCLWPPLLASSNAEGHEARSVWTKRQAVTGRQLQHPPFKERERGARWVGEGGRGGV